MYDTHNLVNCGGAPSRDSNCGDRVGFNYAKACEDAFEENDVTGVCAFDEVTIDDSDAENPLCVITADCRTTANAFPLASSTISVTLPDVAKLENCAGTLTNGSC